MVMGVCPQIPLNDRNANVVHTFFTKATFLIFRLYLVG